MALIAQRKNWNDYVANAETIARSDAFCHLRNEILARAEIRDGDCVVDLGAGTGLLTLAAAAIAERVWAVDISPGMCEYLRAKVRSAELPNIHPVVASVVSLPLVDGCVDVAISNYCFHHLSEGEKRTALAEGRRVLAPGGRLVFADMMFSLSPTDGRGRAVVWSKVRLLFAKGIPGIWRLARNLSRWLLRRWEQPAPPEWWIGALREAEFTDVQVQLLHHEGGIACARKRPSGTAGHPPRESTPVLAGSGR